MAVLEIAVRFHGGRFHGQEWPPAPARLFQALLAAAARGDAVAEEDIEALRWIEGLAEPVIAAPPARRGRGCPAFVPNNDLDTVGGDPSRAAAIRAARKLTRPWLLGPGSCVVYRWAFDQDERGSLQAARIARVANRLYQFGRGVDMAWGSAEITGDGDREDGAGNLHRPAKHGAVLALACPRPGSLQSLQARYLGNAARFARVGKKTVASNAPPPSFRMVAYRSPVTRLVFDLRAGESPQASFAAWPPAAAKRLAEVVRDGAAHRLAPWSAVAELALAGRGAGDAAKRERVKIIPLPSIGHAHADHQIRRVVVEVPPDCPIPVGDLRWAFTGLEIPGKSAHMRAALLVPADDEKFLRHFGVGDEGAPARLWRTVTPAALPWPHGRARSGPARLARDRRLEQGVRQALRHAGIEAPVARIRVQREPYDRNGARAESFAAPPRFPAGLLWHVEIAFATPLTGPLVIGDGRYLGLGVMAPCREARRAVIEFGIEGPAGLSPGDAPALTTAVRRAIMARARDELGNGSREIPRLFSGHERDGGAARSGRQEHIFIAVYATAAAGGLDRLLVAAPWACDKFMSPEHRDDDAFDRVVSGLRTVTMGPTGVLRLALPGEPQDGSRALGPATVWVSATRYRATRHPGRGKDPVTAIAADVAAECRRRGLPEPRVELGAVRAGPKGGRPEAEARLAFSVAVRGPILLGRDCHLGGGLFLAEPIR